MSSTEKQIPKGVWFAFTTVLLDAVGIGIIFPIMPDLLADLGVTDLGQASVWGGILTATHALMLFLAAPTIGALSDRYGRRPVLLLAMAAMAGDYLIQGFATSIAVLFIGRFIGGIVGSTYSTALAYVADVSTPETRSQNFGLLGAAFGVGFVLGPVLGGLALEWGVRAPFFIAAGLSFLNVLFGLLVLPESLPPEKRRAFSLRSANPLTSLFRAFRLPGLGALVFAWLLFELSGVVYPAMWAFWSKYTFGWDGRMIGISLASYGVMLIIAQGWLIRIVIPRLGEVRTIWLSASVNIVALIGFGLVSEGWMVFVLIALVGGGDLFGPALQGILANRVGDDRQGELQGVLASLSSVAAFIAPYPFSLVFNAFTREDAMITLPGAPFLLAGFLLVMALVVIAGSLSQPGKSPHR